VQRLPRELFEKYCEFIPKYLQQLYNAEKTYIVIKNGKRAVYAKQLIKKNAHVFRISGPIVRYAFEPNYSIGYQWFAIGKNAWIVPLRHTPWWAIQHSCEPNVGVIGRDTVVAMRDIQPDEELFVDDSSIEADPKWTRTCECDSPHCRGSIRSVQFLTPELFKQYKSYMPTFLRRTYLKANR
jgi:hypothetical protein